MGTASFDLQFKKGILVCAAKGDFNVSDVQTILHCPSMFPKNGTFIVKADAHDVYETIVPGLQQLGDVTWKNIPLKKVASVKKFSFSFGHKKDFLRMVLKTGDKIKLKEALAFLKQYQKTDDTFALYDGTLYELDKDKMDSYASLAEMAGAGQDEDEAVIPLADVHKVNKIMQAIPVVEKQCISLDDDTAALIKDVSEPFKNHFPVPQNINAVLYPYQENGYQWLSTLQHYNLGAILADDMGLGKSLQTISLVEHVFEAGNTDPVLIVCPSSLVYNWSNEFKKFVPHRRTALISGEAESRHKKIADPQNMVLITSYNTLQHDYELYMTKKFSMVIADEAQYIKNPETLNAQSIKTIHAPFKLALSGTPIENKLQDLWSLFDFILPGFLRTKSDFNKKYSSAETTPKALDELHDRIAPYILRRMKKDVLTDLPEKTEEKLYVKMDDEQQKLYDAEVAKLRALIEHKTTEEFDKEKLFILSQITKLRQLCCAPELLYDNFTGENAKLNATFDLLENALAGGHKVLLFSQFTRMLELLAKRFTEQNIPYYLLTGDTTPAKRAEMVRSFQSDDVPVFCISLKAGGTGLTLTAADIVIHYDPWWNVSAENQASDRAYRIGQKNPVTVYKIICKNAIEEQILNIQEKRKKLAESMLSGESISDTNITREDLLDILKDSEAEQ